MTSPPDFKQISALPPVTNHITTHTPDGAATFHSSDAAKWVSLFDDKMAFNVVYTTSQFPAQLSASSASTSTNPAATYPSDDAPATSASPNTAPGANVGSDLQAHTALMASGGPGLAIPTGTVCRIVDFAPGCPVVMHRTQSLDYGCVLEGEFELVLESEEEGKGERKVLRRGDSVVQRATMHAWKNVTPVSSLDFLFLLVFA